MANEEEKEEHAVLLEMPDCFHLRGEEPNEIRNPIGELLACSYPVT